MFNATEIAAFSVIATYGFEVFVAYDALSHMIVFLIFGNRNLQNRLKPVMGGVCVDLTV
jgi:hypothetical protein